MGDMAGDHVHLVGMRDRDQHVGIAGAGPLQDLRMGGVADQALHVEGVRQLFDQLARDVDDSDVIVLAGEIAGDVEADLAGAAHDDLHVRV